MGHHHHNHDHHHGHEHHHHTPNTFNLAFGLAVSLNFLFTITEAVYAVTANSMSLLADAGHNLGDVLGLLFAWGASWLVTKGVTKKFSYGYKRTTILAAIANALILVATSAIIAYESIHKLIAPVSVHEMTVIVIALIGIFINGGTALLFMRGQEDDLNIKGAFLHLSYDALLSFGVVVTGIIILFTGYLWLDPIIGIVIVLMILWGTWGLLRNSINLILDAVPHNINIESVKDYLESINGVTAVHDLHIWGLSTKEAALTCHLVVPDRLFTEKDYQTINHELQDHFKIHHTTIQIETGKTDISCGQTCA